TSAACGDTVYDTGGAASNYSDNESYTITYLPDTAANVVTLDFILVDLENCCDTLTIYDGSDTSAPVLAADLQGPAVFSALNPAGAITVEFNSDSSVNRAGWEANYTCTPRPSCSDVSSVTIDSVTSDAITVSWSENNTPAGTAWEVVAVPGGDPAPVAGTSNATTNPYTITSLTANTSYDVYVRADCSTTFVGPTSLTTLCSPVVAPYTENFDNAGAIPACWNQGIQNSENWLFADGTASEPAHGGNNGAIVDHTSGTGFFAWVNDSSPHSTGTSLESVLVDVSGLTSPALSFWINSDREDSTNVQFSVDFWDGAAWNIGVYTSNSNTNGWAQGLVDLSVYTITGPVQARFVVDENNGTDFDDDFAIDDVSFDEAPSCFAPTNAVVTAISTDGATIDYTNSNTSTNTNIEYGALGFVQGTGTSLSYTTIPFSLTGLMSGTTYDYYLQSDCGMGDITAWVGPFSFTTDCSAVADFNENFDAVSTPNLANCWSSFSTVLGSGTQPYVQTSTLADETAPNGVRLYSGSLTGNIGSGTTNEGETILISPQLNNLSAGTHRVKFFADAGTSTSTLEVGTITDPTDPSTFTLLSALAPTTTHSEFIVNFDSYTGTDQYIAFRHIFVGTFDSMYLDNIVWEAIPSCPDTSNLTLVSNTDVTATINFDSGNPTSAGNYEYSLTTVSGATPAVSGSWSDVAGATPNVTYTITGLTAETDYFVHVREVCVAGNEGPWSTAPLFFTTSCAAVSSFPYTTDFTNNVPNACWNEAGSGEIVNGPMNVGSSDWKAGRSYENFAGTATPSNLINLYSNNDREWLISESYDMSGTSNDVLSIEVAVTDYQFSGASDATDTDTMGSDDQVDLLITTDAGMTWTSLMTWTAANQPSVTGTREFIDLSSYTGTVQFAFFASDGTVNDTEDYDFHVGMFIIDGTAGNEDVFASTLSLYPNPVNGDVVTISMGHTSASSIEVAVFNTLGQQVMTRSFDQVNHTINIDNISSLSNGMYFVKVTSSTQQATLKFIKE
uniref:T9SS type A sorting domain-containing protein n=2 Tax=Nonlabens sp. TaxID=1888209 RepID=UPI0025FC9E93